LGKQNLDFCYFFFNATSFACEEKRAWNVFRAATGAEALGPSWLAVELATAAFLVVFSLLISDFFWMVTVGCPRF
jgi:hypothetical protein